MLVVHIVQLLCAVAAIVTLIVTSREVTVLRIHTANGVRKRAAAAPTKNVNILTRRANTNKRPARAFPPRFLRFCRFVIYLKKKKKEGVVTIVITMTPQYVETQRSTGRTPRPCTTPVTTEFGLSSFPVTSLSLD